MKRIMGFIGMAGFLVLISVPEASANPKPQQPSWLKDIGFDGNLRLRYEHIDNDAQPGNNVRSRNYYRYLLLVGAQFHPDDQIDLGIRLGSSGNSGAQSGQASQNVTLDDAFRDDPFYIDRAYLKYRPDIFHEMGITIAGGKTANPYVSSGLLWDADISPEGAYVMTEPKMMQSHRVSSVNGYWVYEEENQGALTGFNPGKDAYMTANQIRAGLDNVGPLDFDFWASYYHFVRLSLVSRPAANVAFGNNSNDGNRLTSEFSIWNLGAVGRTTVGHHPVSIMFEWAKNDRARPNPGNGQVEDKFIEVMGRIGRIEMKGDWEAQVLWADVESDAIPSFFMEGDWGSGLGNTNFKGWMFRVGYGLTDASVMSVAYYKTDESNAIRNDPGQRLVQVDLTAYF